MVGGLGPGAPCPPLNPACTERVWYFLYIRTRAGGGVVAAAVPDVETGDVTEAACDELMMLFVHYVEIFLVVVPVHRPAARVVLALT